jgi:uncharacterized protein (TIGR02145 family)
MVNNLLKKLTLALGAALVSTMIITHVYANTTQQFTSDPTADVAPTIDLTIDSTCDSTSYAGNNVTLNVTPRNGGVLTTCPNVVTVSTNSPGFKLLFRANSESLLGAPDNSHVIPSTANLVPNTLLANTWGYAVPAIGNANHDIAGIPPTVTAGFGNSYTTYASETPIPNAKYAKIPTTDLLIKELNDTDIGANMLNNKTTFHYGVTADLETRAGAYQTSIIYTVIAKDLPPELEVACISGNKFRGELGTMQSLAVAQLPDIGDTGIAIDNRNNQRYCVGRLADGKVWMLNNLKLDGVSTAAVKGSAVLTPADTNITSNWTVPAAGLATADHSEQPVIDQDITTPGAKSNQTDITAADFYGYYYNWCAAKGGTPESCTVGNITPTTNAYDICPAGWRLPTGSATGDLAVLNGSMFHGAPSPADTTNEPDYVANWQFSGPFHGVLSGYRHDSVWRAQGTEGVYWTATFSPANPYYALRLFFTPSLIVPGISDGVRSGRFVVRCVLH